MQNQNASEDPRTRDAVYVVAATNEERHMLWREYSADAHASGWGSPGNKRIAWAQDNPGWLRTVGVFGGMPVALALTFERLAGRLVIFWEATSQVVDYRMCEAWLEENVPAYASRHHSDAANFGHCLAFLESQS